MNWLGAAAVFAAALIASGIGTRAALAVIRRLGVLDRPNERSSHAVPTPRGGGIAAVVVVVAAAVAVERLAGAVGGAEVAMIAAAALGLALISWLDDVRGVPVVVRLLGQTAAVAMGLAAMGALGGERLYFAGLLPAGLDPVGAAFLWVWFLNLFNFMDGIDGIAGAESAALGIGVAVVAAIAGLGAGYAALGLAAAGAALGFLWWNWPPAKVFMGDVGSVPLGFVLGWLLLGLAGRGLWAAAVILPLYYLADATLTLLRRAARREILWRAHREHFYQQAVRRGFGHGAVVVAVTVANLGLVGLAAAATLGYPGPALAAAAVVVAALIAYLALAPAPKRAAGT